MKLIFRPLESWTRPVHRARQRSPFRAPYDATIDLLSREARLLGAKVVIVELAINDSDLRRDGLPYAGTRAEHPGVTVALDTRHGPLKYTADRYSGWVENLRAVALGLEALRKVDRYGMTTRGEQYAGWKALPPPADDVVARGKSLIVQHGGFREALKVVHPDKGGNDNDLRAVLAAKEKE